MFFLLRLVTCATQFPLMDSHFIVTPVIWALCATPPPHNRMTMTNNAGVFLIIRASSPLVAVGHKENVEDVFIHAILEGPPPVCPSLQQNEAHRSRRSSYLRLAHLPQIHERILESTVTLSVTLRARPGVEVGLVFEKARGGVLPLASLSNEGGPQKAPHPRDKIRVALPRAGAKVRASQANGARSA